jgi:hypothetical protein
MGDQEVRGATDQEIGAARRLCFFAHYHPRGIVADYVIFYLAALRDAGFTTVVLSTAELSAAEQDKLRGHCARLVMRANVGLDFGGWIEAFGRFAPIRAELLLLANDSVYGPIGDLAMFIDRLTATPADFYGAVESWEGTRHLQSWFLLLRPRAYRSAAFTGLMADPIPPSMPKLEIIQRYELQLLQALSAEGLTHASAWSPDRGGPIARALRYNPAQALWKTLVGRVGMPFIKVELLRDNPLHMGGVRNWRRFVRRRAPALVPMIEADLALRNARRLPTIRDRFGFSRAHPQPAYRPELQLLINADAAGQSPARSAATQWLFERVVAIGDWYRRRKRQG